MGNNNAEKSRQLGMPFGTAGHRLRKQIIFHLMQECGLDQCHQCGEIIEDIDNLSIEHKKPWLHELNAAELFFDMNNIAFSHTKCNYSNQRPRQNLIPCSSMAAYYRGCRCDGCKEAKRQYRHERGEH